MTDEQGRILAGAVMVLVAAAMNAIPSLDRTGLRAPSWMVLRGIRMMGWSRSDPTALPGYPMAPVIDAVFRRLDEAFGEKL